MNRRNMSPKDGRSEARESHSTDEVDIRARHLSAMLASLAALQRSAALCDVLLQVEPESATSEAAREAAGTGVWAHRAVLGAASPYFHNIFENSDQQCKRLVIMVPRVTSKILRLLVDNVYTPTSLSVTVEEGKSLLAAATHLTVADVRDEATTCLARSLAVDNVLGIYVTAESNDCPALTALAANFMQKNGEHVLQVDELLSLQPSMLGELLAGGRLAAPAQSALKAVLRWTMHRPQERRQHLSSLLEVVQLPQVPRPLLFEITRKEPIVNNAYALRLIILACLTDTDHDTQESTKNKKKSSRRVESELAFSRTSSEHRPVVSTDHAPLAVGDCNKNADVIPDVSSFEHRAVVSTAHAPLAVGDCNKNADIIPDESSSEHRAVISTAHASLAVGICNKSAKIIPDVSSSEHRAVVSTAHTPLAVGDCNKNADIIPDVSSSEHRAVVSTAHAPLAVGVCNKSAKIIPDVSSSEHRAAVSTAHASLAVGDYNKNAEIIPNMTSELSSGSRQSTALLSAARTAAGAAMLDDNVFKGTKNEQKSDRIVDNELAISTSSDHRAAVSAPHALLVMGGHKKGTKCTADVLSFELSSGRWQSAATLPETRAEAGIALLDGRVYVIGGLHDRERLNTVVVYDVARGSWSSGPSLSMARCQLAAAALDGVLYAIGGRDAGSRFLRTVEAFDPREGVWRTIANMPTERSALGVAGLHGRLYAAGGENFTGKLDRVERYDPSSAKWERVDCMARSRCNVAVGVVDDALYAVGGYDNWTTHDTVERYRVASGWERAPSMIMERWGAAVASHSGRLYVAGGRNHWNVILSSVEVFSPSSAAWRELPNMPEGRVAASAVVVHWQPHGTKNEQKSSRSVDNKQQQHLSNAESPESGMSPVLRQTFDERCEESSALLVVGGYKKSTGCTADVLSYKPSSHRWQSAAALPAARGGAGVAVLDGRVYVVGGHNGDSAVNTVFVYDVARGSWSSGPSLITSRWQLAAATLDGVLYAVGGQDSGDTHLSSAEAFDPREGVWRSIASMSTGRAGLGVATMQGRLYAVGGENGTGALNSVDRYNPSSAMWEPVHRMSERRSGVAVCVMNRAIYAAGGWNGSTTHRSVERYRAGSGWKPAPSMITARWGATMASHDGRLYVAGGFNDRDDFLSSVEVFSSLTTSWSELRAAMPTGRSFAAAVVVHWPPTDP